MGDKTAPNCQLSLEWVYGYRGHQVRSNLYYNKDQEIVYFVAGVAIVYNQKEHKQQFFLGHDDDIISLNLHPDKLQVATGQVGKAPQIIVWDTKTLKTTSILKGGHTEGVGILCFDSKGERLASCGIDQDSTIAIWDWKKGKLLAKSTGHQERIFDLQFSFFKENALVSCGVKQISFWTLTGNTLQKKKGIFGQTKDITTMFSFAYSKEKDKEIYYSGTINGQIYVWKGNQLEEILPGAHESSVYVLIEIPDGYATAGKDGLIRTWDSNFHPIETINLRALLNSNEHAELYNANEITIRSIYFQNDYFLIGTQSSEIFQINMKDPTKVECLCNGHSEGELWSLAVSPVDKNIFATASDDKTLRIWNLNDHQLLKMTKLEKRIRSCSFSADGKSLACGLSDGRLVIVNTDTMSQNVMPKLRNEVLHEIKYSPCGKYLAAGSNENYVDIYSVPDYKRRGVCSGNSSFITHLDWSKDSKYIQTNSGDGSRLIYKCPNGEQVTNKEELKKIEWETFTGVLGDEVVGIWEKYTNKTDVNATDAYFDQKCLVTGDDFGLVKLFRFPSLKKGAKFRKYVGHSSHVTNVRFTKDKTRVISIGGADHAIFQWHFIPEHETTETSRDAGQNEDSARISTTRNYQAYLDSNSEESDSELSGKEIDSDIENEKQIVYDKEVYKDDLKELKPKIKEEIKKAEAEMRLKRQDRPDISLNIEFVYGYRGYDCRDNLFCVKQAGLIVYHVAALGIVYNQETQKQEYYNQHTDDILCLCVYTFSPTKNFCATGQVGRDPAIHVWEIETLKTISILKGEHYRGVCSVSFSSDGKKLASVGLDDNHTICVWDWKKGEKLATTRGNKDKIFSIKWNPHGGDKLVTVGIKHIKFWNQVGGGFTSNRGLFGKLSPVENMMCITFGKDPNVCYTGGGNGCIFVWVDQKLTKLIQAHSGPVFAIYAYEGWDAYATGGKDGSIILWDEKFDEKMKHKYDLDKNSLSKQTKGVLLFDKPSVRAICYAYKKILIGTKNGEIIYIDKNGVISILTQGHGEGEVWGLSCHPTKLECCTAGDDKTVRIWNIEPNNHYMINGQVFEKPVRACAYSNNGNLIIVGFKDGTVHVLKTDTLESIKKINHRNQEISDIKFSPEAGKYAAVGSHENTIDIYHVETGKRVGICKGASSYITHVEWDTEGKLLMTNSGAKEILYFEAPRGNRVNIRAEDVEKINWHTFTSVLGPTCVGIWPPCTDVTDVNSTCLNKDKNCLATGDDFGLVKLFDYPCLTKFAKFKKYNAHSSHVTNVRWALNDSRLVSTGGNDTSVIVWANSSYVEASDHTENLNTSSLRSAELVQKNKNKGESDDSDTDSENEGYDSDVRHEYEIDYNKMFFENQIKRPTIDTIKDIYKEVAATDKMESSKPSRMVKTKFKRTKINNMKTKDGKEVDPLTLIHFMSKMTIMGNELAQQDSQASNYDTFKTEINGLKLSHIHGYRGFDCRDNLFYINDGTAIVYHAAAAGIVLDMVNHKQSFYLEHTDDIISLCVNGNPKYKNIIATGQIGKLSAIHVWDAITKKQHSILTGLHNDIQGVCSLNFSSSGKLLVSVGLDDKYTIGVWRWKEGSLVASATGDHKPNRIFRAMFRPDSDTVIVSVGFKHVKFWNVAGSELIKKRGVLTSSVLTKDKLKKMPTMLSLAFGLDNVTYTGSMTGEVFVWKDNVLTRVVNDAHRGPIFSMHTSLFDGCIVTGAKEKKSRNSAPVKLWDKDMKTCLKSFFIEKDSDVAVVKSVCRFKSKANKILIGTKSASIYEISEKINDIDNVVAGHGEGNFHGLCVHPTKEIFCTASYDGFVRIWDNKAKKLISKHNTDREVHSVDFSPDGNMIALGFSDGQIVLLRCVNNYEKLEKCDSNRQRKACVSDIKFSPNHVNPKRFAAGLSDCTIDFFDVSQDGKLSRIGYCKQVPGPVTSIDWSSSGEYIKVSTDNHKRIVFNAPDGNEIKLETIQDTVEWSQWTSIFDPEVIGIWAGYEQKADNSVNCSHLAAHAMKLAIGDDDGAVKLFKFPCLDKDEECQSYYGHSSHVTNVKFLNNNSHLISIGGLDCCVFVWECE